MFLNDMERQATEDQGLMPVLARLAAEGIDHGIDQTGGYNMCVRVPLAGAAWIWITDDIGLSIGRYVDQDDEFGTTLASRASLDEMVAIVRTELGRKST